MSANHGRSGRTRLLPGEQSRQLERRTERMTNESCAFPSVAGGGNESPRPGCDHYSVGVAFASFAFASVFCFAKCSRAAFAASSVMIQEVFFASIARGYVLRRKPRSDFGSQPISFARTFGAYVFSFVIFPPF